MSWPRGGCRGWRYPGRHADPAFAISTVYWVAGEEIEGAGIQAIEGRCLSPAPEKRKISGALGPSGSCRESQGSTWAYWWQIMFAKFEQVQVLPDGSD